MTLLETAFVDIAIRSYDSTHAPDRHDYAQLVLPVTGQVQLDMAGAHGQVDPARAAVVVAGAWHAQRGIDRNRSLILDIDQQALVHAPWADLLDRPFTGIGPAARKLIEFMALCLESGTVQTPTLRGWAPLLFDTLASGVPQVHSRLGALLAQLEAEPGLPWSTESMARYARVSVSGLHALFREELDSSPHAWLLRRRIEFACELLAHTRRGIAEVALASGFGDQSALTRAMRQNIDTTPAAYRNQRQETGTKQQ